MPTHTPATPHSSASLAAQTLILRPASGDPAQLFILLHGVGSQAANLLPLGKVLQQRFPQAAVVLPEGFDDFDAGPSGRQWFSIQGVTEENRPARVAAVLPRLIALVEQIQSHLKVSREATALGGFSQGAIVSLEAAQQVDGLAGRVLAFSGRYAKLPEVAPQLSTLHLFHGSADTVIPVAYAKDAIAHLSALQADATIDIAEGVGHELHPALVDCALHVLTNHLPQRSWREALSAARAAQSDD